MDNCIFCKIANKEIESRIVYEDENVIAFEDLNPMAKIHILVIPKKHYCSLNDITGNDMDTIVKIHTAIKEIVKIKNISDSGYRIVSNCGDDAGQTVKHLHYHILGGEKLGDL